MVSANSGVGNTNKALTTALERAMSAAVTHALEVDGISIEDSPEIRRRMMAARQKALERFRQGGL